VRQDPNSRPDSHERAGFSQDSDKGSRWGERGGNAVVLRLPCFEQRLFGKCLVARLQVIFCEHLLAPKIFQKKIEKKPAS
jgi:hypothetical protein